MKLEMVSGALLVAVLAAQGLVGGSSSPPYDQAILPQSAPDQATRTELARRFAPLLRFDSHELFRPIPRSAYVGVSSLRRQDPKGHRAVVDATPRVSDLPAFSSLTCPGCRYVLDVKGVEPPHSTPRDYARIQSRLAARGTAVPTVYAHVVRYDSTGEYAVQYWLLYLLNYRLNVHESDWEQITVRLDPSKRPLGAFYSSYGTGIQKDWHDVEREREHPVAYVALGSHANYFEAGWHAVHLDCPPSYRSLRICVRGRIIRDLADGRAPLRPQEYEVTELSAPVFVGSYGDVNYIAGRRQQTNIADPRLRLSWRNALKSEIVAEKHPIDVRSH